MPKFLEEKLEKEYGDNKHAIYGTMNKIGAMKGNKETAKGREMEKKHEEKECKHCGSKHHKSHEHRSKHKALEKAKE